MIFMFFSSLLDNMMFSISSRFFEVFVHVIAIALLYSFINPKLAFAHLISLIVQDIINDMFLVLIHMMNGLIIIDKKGKLLLTLLPRSNGKVRC
jgi:hypothetical protein